MARVGEQRKRVREYTREHLDHHQADDERESHAKTAAIGVRVHLNAVRAGCMMMMGHPLKIRRGGAAERV